MPYRQITDEEIRLIFKMDPDELRAQVLRIEIDERGAIAVTPRANLEQVAVNILIAADV